MATRLAEAFGSGPRPVASEVAAWVGKDQGFRAACRRGKLTVHDLPWPAPVMYPAPGPPGGWAVPAIVTPESLADFSA